MMILITGGSGSGKSAYAEEYITAISKDCTKYYIATMLDTGGEGSEKIKRHQEQRKGKGFCTIEQPVSVDETLSYMEPQSEKGKALSCMEKQPEKENTALLECISNLTANEMFSGENPKSRAEVTEKIVQDVGHLREGVKHLVIVTNNIFEDGNSYEEPTMEYIRAMGNINERLAAMADKVIEVVVGIPVVVKEGK